LLVLAIFLGSLMLFFTYVGPSLKGENQLRIGADSAFYLWHANLSGTNPYGRDDEQRAGLIAVASNLLGPYLIATLLRDNLLILAFNYLLLLVSVILLTKNKHGTLALLMLLNPAVLVAILSVALLAWHLEKPSRTKLSLLLLVSLMARWEMSLLVLLFLLLRSRINPCSRRMTVLFLIVTLTVTYPFVTGFVNQAFGEQSGNTVVMLTNLQARYLYFLVLIPKIALNLFGGLVGLFRPATNDVYNSLIVPWSCVANLLATIWFIFRRKFTLSNDLVYFAVLLSILFAITPFVQIRYFLPVYPILLTQFSRRIEHGPRFANN
jgi:hypothetical protein